MSFPPVGAPIMVTVTAKNGEVGKFIGAYAPEDEFILRPLPGKRYIQQFPMYPNQPNGGNYALGKNKEAVDPYQDLVDVWGIDEMHFPGLNLTWESLKPLTKHTEDEILEDLLKIKDPSYDPKSFIHLKCKKNPRVIKASLQEDPLILKHLSVNDGLTYELLIELVEEEGTFLEVVPITYKTYEICLAAVRTDPNALQFVPESIKENPDFCDLVIDYNPDIFDEVPVNMLSEEMIIKLIDQNPVSIYYISFDQMSPKMITKILDKNPLLISSIPDDKLTDEMIIEALDKNPRIIDKISYDRLTDEMITKALDKNPNIINVRSIKNKVGLFKVNVKFLSL